MGYNLITKTTVENLTTSIKKYFATQTAFETLESRVDGIVSEGGEPNIIEAITVNGTAQEITNKTVNLTIPVKVSELENDSEFATASDVSEAVAKIVDDAPESYNTLKEIADWIEGHADSAAEMNTEIKANASDIAELQTLIGSLPDNAQSTTVIAYISEAINDAIENTNFSDLLTKDDISDYTVEEIDALFET